MYTYSIIIPVYNRPAELDELLHSLCGQTYIHFEVVVVEDGSTLTSEQVVANYQSRLTIHYYQIENRGPGGARNYGAERSRGNYLLILDSDVLLSSVWMEQVHDALKHYPVDYFGGADRAHASFSPIQKAVSYAMTAFLTTGGIRGGKRRVDSFFPRSYNMGIRREAYFAVEGFSDMRYGEDIDLSLRLMEAGYRSRLFPAAWVYHKRRTSFGQFFRQVCHSGEARVALSKRHPGTLKPVHLFPTLFLCGVVGLGLLSLLFPLALLPVAIYGGLLWIDATVRAKGNVWIGTLSVAASFVQLFGYGWGLLSAAIHPKR